MNRVFFQPLIYPSCFFLPMFHAEERGDNTDRIGYEPQGRSTGAIQWRRDSTVQFGHVLKNILSVFQAKVNWNNMMPGFR